MIFQVTDKDEAETETGKEVIEEEGTVEAGIDEGDNDPSNGLDCISKAADITQEIKRGVDCSRM